ncbi:hypothetical protein CDAR_579251 [Caerostris darwini]|uniref:Uncharacterized protein n=1 Tax=Caerostris darwini TaxID=1538125 RepID=A0AAV4SMV9_9ARAC|nr:hypothetical protein CDAR_579251 [Caerostris darwini]
MGVWSDPAEKASSRVVRLTTVQGVWAGSLTFWVGVVVAAPIIKWKGKEKINNSCQKPFYCCEGNEANDMSIHEDSALVPLCVCVRPPHLRGGSEAYPPALQNPCTPPSSPTEWEFLNLCPLRIPAKHQEKFSSLIHLIPFSEESVLSEDPSTPTTPARKVLPPCLLVGGAQPPPGGGGDFPLSAASGGSWRILVSPQYPYFPPFSLIVDPLLQSPPYLGSFLSHKGCVPGYF